MNTKLTKKELEGLKELSVEYEKIRGSQNSINKTSTQEVDMAREKYWDELNVEEKIERMRVNVKNVQFSISQLRDDVESLFEHAHDKDGKLIFVLNKDGRYRLRQGGSFNLSGGLSTQTGSSSKQTYF